MRLLGSVDYRVPTTTTTKTTATKTTTIQYSTRPSIPLLEDVLRAVKGIKYSGEKRWPKKSRPNFHSIANKRDSKTKGLK